jgi:putative endonuclease
MDNFSDIAIISTRHFGQEKECEACKYLEQQGLKLLESNYNCKCGEVDLIMDDRGTVVFIEVRYRQNKYYGTGLESVTRRKQRKIIKAAEYYLLVEKIGNCNCRFDVVTFENKDGREKCVWVKDAFWARF